MDRPRPRSPRPKVRRSRRRIPGFALERLEDRRMLAFGITTSATPTGQQTYVIDNGGDLTFAVLKSGSTSSTIHIGDLTSIQYKNRELLAPYSTTARYSHCEQGLSAGTIITTAVGGSPGSRWIVVSCDGTVTGTGSAAVVQYYAVRENDNNLYMASYVPNPSTEGRFIAYLQRSIFTGREAPSDNGGNTGAIEGGDVFGHADGTTSSKFYNVGGRRQIDHVYHGVTGTASGIPVGAWMFMGSRERSSGGPFFKDIDFQSGSSVEIYNCIFTGHTQTEPYRAGLHTYALQLNDGQTPTEPSYAWLEQVTDPTSGDFFIQGLIPASERGRIGGVATNIAAGHEITVGLSNAEAQYWDVADAAGNYLIEGVLPGTYVETLYDGELEVGRRTVTIAAGQFTTANIANTYHLPPNPVFRIGTFDGSPVGFLNADKIETMHPSDVRMTSWTSLPNFVVGTNTAAQFPMAQFMGVNNSQRFTFTLTSAQVQDLTFRVGITLGFEGARPKITVNGGRSYAWTSGNPTYSVDLNSRGVTRGTWRGVNQLYTFGIPASAFRVGTNTIDMGMISGSYVSGATWLSPNAVFDAIDLVPTASANPPPISTLTVVPGGTIDAAGFPTSFRAAASGPAGEPLTVNVDWSASPGSISPNGGYSAPPSTTAIAINATATITRTPGFATGTRSSSPISDSVTATAAFVRRKADTRLLADEVDGNVLADASGNDNSAVLTGSRSFVAGMTGGAVQFSGGSATLPAGIVAGLDDFTIAAWVKPDAIADWQRIFDFGSSTSSYMFLTTKAGGAAGMRFAIRTASVGEQQVTSSVPLAIGVWQHVAVTLRGNLATLYLNGIAVGSNPAVTLRPASLGVTANNFLGKSQFTGDPPLRASVDDFQIVSRALTAAEVTDLATPDAVLTVAAGETVTDVVRTGRGALIKNGTGTVVLGSANSHSGGTVIAAGTAIIRNIAALGTGGLVVQAGATVRLDVGLNAIALPMLQLETAATLDLGFGRLTVAAGGMTAADARSRIIAGRNGGSWTGAGITSSVAAADAARAVGYRTAADGSLEIAWAALGDANLDGTLDPFDLVEIASGGGFGSGQATSWAEGDFTYDGVFNAFDLIAMQSTELYGRGSYLPQLAAGGEAAAGIDPLLMFAALAHDPDDE